MTPLLALIPVVERIFDRVLPDPEQKAKAILELKKEENQQALQEMTIELQAKQGQMEINKIEAGSASLFVAGWRPWLGWVCGTAFAYHFVIQPLIAFLMASAGHQVNLPVFDMEALNTVLFGMLGLGGMRTYEKTKGVTR